MDHNKTVPNTFARSLGLRGFFILSLWPLLAPVNCLAAAMSGIRLSADQSRFVLDKDNSTFIPWGFNYDHDRDGRLLEDYWQSEWPTVEEDFREIKQLGANVVRVHLQLGKFMSEPNRPNPAALERLGRLIELAEGTGLYLDITGLGCYHKKDVPAWYDALSEAKRWQVQVRFWQAVAETAAPSPAVFCYDLMNEPILPGENQKETDWLAGEFAGKHFVQRISLDLAGRTRTQVAAAWVRTLAAAIRTRDRRHLLTVGVIPWAHVFPQARPLFYDPQVAGDLDFVSVHFYPKSKQVDKALGALKVYDIGRPIVVEEMFPLECNEQELRTFILSSRPPADGWMGFYWGKRPEEYTDSDGIAGALTRNWLSLFQDMSAEILTAGGPGDP